MLLYLYSVFKVPPDPLLARQVLSQLSYTPMGAFIIHTDLLPNYKQQKMG